MLLLFFALLEVKNLKEGPAPSNNPSGFYAYALMYMLVEKGKGMFEVCDVVVILTNVKQDYFVTPHAQRERGSTHFWW